MICSEKLAFCNNVGTYKFEIKFWNTLPMSSHETAQVGKVSQEFEIGGHKWQLKFWLCFHHLHYEFIKKTKSSFSATFKLTILTRAAGKNNTSRNKKV